MFSLSSDLLAPLSTKDPNRKEEITVTRNHSGFYLEDPSTPDCLQGFFCTHCLFFVCLFFFLRHFSSCFPLFPDQIFIFQAMPFLINSLIIFKFYLLSEKDYIKLHRTAEVSKTKPKKDLNSRYFILYSIFT